MVFGNAGRLVTPKVLSLYPPIYLTHPTYIRACRGTGSTTESGAKSLEIGQSLCVSISQISNLACTPSACLYFRSFDSSGRLGFCRTALTQGAQPPVRCLLPRPLPSRDRSDRPFIRASPQLGFAVHCLACRIVSGSPFMPRTRCTVLRVTRWWGEVCSSDPGGIGTAHCARVC